jgi:ribonuclease BN (tRNA processing enzyme)
MEVQVLGAHNCESTEGKLTSLLIDQVLALDVGGLTSSLSLSAQAKVSTILLTHYHFDHIKDVALIGYYNGLLMGSGLGNKPKLIYSTAEVLDALSVHILNDKIFPDFTHWPSKDLAALKLCPVEPYHPQTIEGYRVVAIPVKHSVPTVGYQVTSGNEKEIFYTGDTGPGLSDCWGHISPQLLITEATGSNRFSKETAAVGHLTPQLLKQELGEFRQLKGYLPKVILIHISPLLEGEIKEEVAQLAEELGGEISLGYEGMKINI